MWVKNRVVRLVSRMPSSNRLDKTGSMKQENKRVGEREEGVRERGSKRKMGEGARDRGC